VAPGIWIAAPRYDGSLAGERQVLACTVRGCGLPLARRPRTCVCPRGHLFDVARSGYVNLLQPQDRRSRSAGDARASVDARARLQAAGVGRAVVEAFVRRAAALDLPDPAVVVDLGSGTGEALGLLAHARAIDAIGIDLSTAAAEHAVRRFPALTWVVANADRRLPLVDGGIDLVLSLHGRRNPAECARVLAPAGFLLLGIPAADDVIELRELVQGRRVERDRTATVLAEHASRFRLLDRTSARGRQPLEPAVLLDLLRATYRGERASAARRVGALSRLEVTLASEFLLLAPR
jgi:23S rRNA (guanine745-N1)-methyltransferase